MVSNLGTGRGVIHDGPFEHASTLKLIETTFGLQSLTARDANATNIADILLGRPFVPDPAGRDPDQQPGAWTASDAAAVCSASVQSAPSPCTLGGDRGTVKSCTRPASRPARAWPDSAANSGISGRPSRPAQ